MGSAPLVSIIIPTKNSDKFLEKCIRSIKSQSYKHIEVIIVDNYSTDKTKDISEKYVVNYFEKGPERSAQRNYGAKKARGKFVLFVDSDMELTKDVVKQCVEQSIEVSKGKLGGVIIPEESVGEGFWAKCKSLERSFYINVDWIEAARFFPKKVFNEVDGFDESLFSGEDWDLSQKVKNRYNIARIKAFIYHNEGKLSLVSTLKKKYYYSRNISQYLAKNKRYVDTKRQASPIRRYKLFFSNPKKLLSNPLVGMGMLYMKACEFGVGAIGYIRK